MGTYNLFRRKNEADLYCAIPEDVAVPEFLSPEGWEYAQSVGLSALSGFDAAAAEVSVQANGFYLFYLAGAPARSGSRAAFAGSTLAFNC